MDLRRWIASLRLRLRAIVHRARAKRDLDDELSFHIAMQAQANHARGGVSETAALQRARRDFGGVQQTRERVRDVWSLRWADDLAADLRDALRTFRRSPGFAATAVVSLAVGIAAATGMFSIVSAALPNPFPFADINRIVRLDMNDKGQPRGLSVTARQLVALQHSDVFDGAFAMDNWEMTLTGQGFPETVGIEYFSANALNVLGVPPLLGRVFNEADGPAGEQPQRVVVLTYRFWQSHFGAGGRRHLGRPSL